MGGAAVKLSDVRLDCLSVRLLASVRALLGLPAFFENSKKFSKNGGHTVTSRGCMLLPCYVLNKNLCYHFAYMKAQEHP